MSRLLLSVLILFTCFAVNAQTRGFEMNEKLNVKDSTGKVLAYNYWRPLVSSGNYLIRSTVTGKDTTYMLRYMTAAQKERFAKLRGDAIPPSTAPPSQPAQQATVDLGPQPRTADAFPIGYKLNMLTTRDMDGKKVDNKMAEGKIVVLNFWFIGCPPCKAEIPELNKLVAENASDPDIIFIAVGLDEAGEIKEFTKQHPFNYRQVADARRFCDGYGVTLYPTNVIIDKKGIIQYSAVGFGGNYIDWMRKTIEVIKKEK